MKNGKTIYEKHGYRNRTEYLKCVALDYGVDEWTVMMMADVLGPSEDFDGLITSLEDYLYLTDNPEMVEMLIYT